LSGDRQTEQDKTDKVISGKEEKNEKNFDYDEFEENAAMNGFQQEY